MGDTLRTSPSEPEPARFPREGQRPTLPAASPALARLDAHQRVLHAFKADDGDRQQIAGWPRTPLRPSVPVRAQVRRLERLPRAGLLGRIVSAWRMVAHGRLALQWAARTGHGQRHAQGQSHSHCRRAPRGRQRGSQLPSHPRGLSDISLAGFEGKVGILNIVPSLDTGLGALGAPLREGGGRPRPAHDTTFLEGLDRAFYWQRLIDEGIVKSGSEIARARARQERKQSTHRNRGWG